MTRAKGPRAAARRGTRAFLTQVADELPSHLPPRLRGFSSEQWGRFYKVWYGAEKKIHFEVQFLRNGRLEIGLHLEADAETNDRLASALERERAAIHGALGDGARFGSHGRGWRSVVETWAGGDMRGEEAATEAASRLAEYVVTLVPLVRIASPTTRRGS
jgi:hypothetical protein